MEGITSGTYIHDKMEPHSLPPGFRFHPTDEELIDYLKRKVAYPVFSIPAIIDVDMNQCEPWDLPGRSQMGEKEWYFFTLRDRKYPTGMRTNRATEAGYWKGTGKDREIYSSRTNTLVGMKKTLVFYKGRAPKGEKTNWIIHEYRLEGNSTYVHHPQSKTSKDPAEWVVCRIFHKMPGGRKSVLRDILQNNLMNSCKDQLFLPALNECPIPSHLANDPELDCTSCMQTDPRSTKFINDNDTRSLYRMENRKFCCWTGSFSENALSKDSSSSSSLGNLPTLLMSPSNIDLQTMNLQGRVISDISDVPRNGKNGEILQCLPQAMTSSIISLNFEPENLVKNISTDLSHHSRILRKQCKAEPYFEVDEAALQSGNKLMPEKYVWTEAGADFDSSQALMYQSFPLDLSSFETNEASSLTYRRDVPLQDKMDDGFWISY